jgi:Zn-dependent protease with chaperone function
VLHRCASALVRPSPRAFLCILVVGVTAGLSLPPSAAGQSPVDPAAARQYADQLERNFWEQAWARDLATRAGRDGTVNWTYDDRQALNDVTTDYQRAIGEADGFWTHLQVQDELQQQLLRVQPNPMMPGRPGAFRLRVLSTTTPNALALNDGTIILTTGLLTTLRTEAELQAVLAHEVAHIVLDHALTTYRSSKKNNRARKLLGSVIGGVTSVMAPVIGGRRPLESTVYDLSAGLATAYLDRDFIAAAGLTYDRDQERAANRLAQEWLLAHDRPPSALHTALRALRRAGLRDNHTHGATFSDSHPGTAAERRETLTAVIADAGGAPATLDAPRPAPDSAYDTPLAAVLEHEAEMDLAARRFHAARSALDRALRTAWATPQTYLFQAIAVRNTTAGADGLQTAFSLLEAAEAGTDGPEPRIEAERALLRVRQDRPGQARRHLARCRAQIDEVRAAADSSADAHAPLRAWATKMQARLSE